jgi:hypothetical protein
MAAPADYLDTVDLSALTAGGLVNEDVAQKLYKLQYEDTPVLDRIGRDSAKNSYSEWAVDELGSASDTKIVSGADVASSDAAAATGSRVGNHAQINRRVAWVTGRARATDNVGRSDELVYQSMMASQRLKQDIEKQITGRQASVADNNNATAGVAAGISAFVATNDSFGTGGASGGFNTSTLVVDAPTAGVARVLTQAMWRAQVLNAYNAFSDVSLMVTTPTLVQGINTFLVGGSGVLRATPTANVSGEAPVRNQSAQGNFNIIVTDFGTVLTIVPDRHMATYTGGGTSSNVATACEVLLLNPEFVAFAPLRGFRSEPLAKVGDSDRVQVLVDWTLKVYNEKAHAVIRDILPSGTVTA